MRIMLRISLVAAWHCLNHLKYFSGTLGTLIYAVRSLQKTIVCCDPAAQKSPIEMNRKCFKTKSQLLELFVKKKF